MTRHAFVSECRANKHIICWFSFYCCCTSKSIDIRNYDCRHGSLIENNHDTESDSPNSTDRYRSATRSTSATWKRCISQSHDRNVCSPSSVHGKRVHEWKCDENQNGLSLAATPVLHFIVCCRCDKSPAAWHSLRMIWPNKQCPDIVVDAIHISVRFTLFGIWIQSQTRHNALKTQKNRSRRRRRRE